MSGELTPEQKKALQKKKRKCLLIENITDHLKNLEDECLKDIWSATENTPELYELIYNKYIRKKKEKNNRVLKFVKFDEWAVKNITEKKIRFTRLKELNDGNETRNQDLLGDISHDKISKEYAVFCCSDLSSLCDDGAQIMLSHYGDSWKGLILVYDHHEKGNEKKLYDVNYFGARHADDGAQIQGGAEFRDGNDLIESYKRKSFNWYYEREKRFIKPFTEKEDEKEKNGESLPASEYGLELRYILYTEKLEYKGDEPEDKKDKMEKALKQLNDINKEFYNENISIIKIIAGKGRYHFLLDDPKLGEGGIYEYLCSGQV